MVLTWRNLEGVDTDLRDIALPSDTEFFQKIKGKSLFVCKLPSMDYSNYNFNDVYIGNSNLISVIFKDIQKYNLNQFGRLDFSSDKFNGGLSEGQANLIKLKYLKE